jgi:hypothetical protein
VDAVIIVDDEGGASGSIVVPFVEATTKISKPTIEMQGWSYTSNSRWRIAIVSSLVLSDSLMQRCAR